jgi:hypothetical protein
MQFEKSGCAIPAIPYALKAELAGVPQSGNDLSFHRSESI